MPRRSKLKGQRLSVGLMIFLLAAITILLWRTGNQTSPKTQGIPSSDVPSTEPNPAMPSRTPPDARGLDARGILHSAIHALRKSSSTDESKRVLAQLRLTLNALPREDASKAVQEVLSSGIDGPTRIEFEVGPGGRLSGASTFRVFLLDYLGEIDPKAAAATAASILGNPEAPDEWAVSLRNFAKANATPEAQNFLRERVGVLLSHEPWQQNPSTGYLEAFDVAVHLGGNRLVPELTRLLRMTNNLAVAHAADLTLDRLVIKDPAPVLSVLAGDATSIQGREITRAGLFARADVSSSDQQRLVENYLLNPVLGADELNAFANVFPNENYRISHNLLTTTPPRPGNIIRQRDREILRVIEDWMKQERFKNILPQLRTVQERLRAFGAGVPE